MAHRWQGQLPQSEPAAALAGSHYEPRPTDVDYLTKLTGVERCVVLTILRYGGSKALAPAPELEASPLIPAWRPCCSVCEASTIVSVPNERGGLGGTWCCASCGARWEGREILPDVRATAQPTAIGAERPLSNLAEFPAPGAKPIAPRRAVGRGRVDAWKAQAIERASWHALIAAGKVSVMLATRFEQLTLTLRQLRALARGEHSTSHHG